jgi:hypothetical protein
MIDNTLKKMQNKINTNRNQITEYIYSKYDEGLMKDYSENHFIFKAMKNELDIFTEYGQFLGKSSIVEFAVDDNFTFLANLSNKLQRCATIFSEEKMADFITNQLSAGKSNYKDSIFFEALSEINVLFYFCNFVGNITEALYEPKLVNTNANPEARFVFNSNVIIDIEVKKANFTNTLDSAKGENGAIKPNIVLNESTNIELTDFCSKNNLQIIYPRISKLGEFIKSAASKFQVPTTASHFNLLFINWTYTDFPECSVNEPKSLFINTENGLFYNDEALNFIKDRNGVNIVSRDDLDKISAVVLYRDTLDTILSGDFRYHFKNNKFKFIVNPINNSHLNFNLLSKLLRMNACNSNNICEWEYCDYNMNIKDTDKIFADLKNIFVKKSIVIKNTRT